MFYYLSKTVYILAMPVTWLVILLIIALFSKGRKKNIYIGLTLFLTYLFCNPILVNMAMKKWEVPPIPYDQIAQPYDVGIILSGAIKHNKIISDRTHTNHAADRILHTADLYHKGLIKQILVTGGYQKIGERSIDESSMIKEILVMANVPDSVITVEPYAVNTHENATRSKEILKAKFPNQRYLIITSAFHMRRSLACFAKEEIQVDGFSVDFSSSNAKLHKKGTAYFPSSKAFNTFNVLVREMVGYVVYKLVGYA